MIRSIFFLLSIVLLSNCQPAKQAPEGSEESPVVLDETPKQILHEITWDIPVRSYFQFLDTVAAHYDSLLPYSINEHLIVRANPWLIDTLENTDYYRLMDRGIFEYDPQSLIVLQDGQSLIIPTETQADSLATKIAATVIDVNIPEYKLRIFENNNLLYTFPVRVGRNETKYLEMAGRDTDLRTRTGIGKIVRADRDPVFINPSDNRRYDVTRRDDQQVTKLPRIPWIEPELNGIRHGHLIHPTTNPKTLGKAYSNGCIGMTEADMWRVYYYAPVGTKVVFRYDLDITNEQGDSIRLKDIYPQSRHRRPDKPIAALTPSELQESPCGCYCSAMD